MATGRSVPPGARRRETTAGPSKNSEELQRPPAELAHDAGGDVFTVELRSNTHYDKLPFGREITHQEDSSNSSLQQFEFKFNYNNIRKLMQWFREIGWKDQYAVLRFPTNLEKPQRKQVHEIAQSFGLGTCSSGFGETRLVSVYSVEKATLGVGKVKLTKAEREKADELWRLVKYHKGDKKYEKISHNEIEEMVLVNKLDPLVQDLWEKRESLQVDDKCKVSDK